MVNVKKLRGKMVEHGISVEELAVAMKIDRATLYRRLEKDGESFTIKEADIIVRTLKLSSSEATSIFFNQFVA
ncbi:MAG: helix-turn-helix domain-containing protein [Lachnospiraceae bacterium]